jgi:MFS superfamily sulfate permease-like transporter
MAEDVYRKLNELREQVTETQQTVIETKERVDGLESEAAEQRALLEAIAEEQGVDLDAVSAEAHIAEAEDGGAETDETDTDRGEEAAPDADADGQSSG